MQQSYVQEIEYISDAEISVVKPQISCPQGNLIERVCLNSQCAVSLICNQSKCVSCGNKVHPDCYDVSFEKFTNLINQPLHIYKKFMNSIDSIQNQHIELLKHIKQEQQFNNPESVVRIHSLKSVEQIYNNKNSQAISGAEAKNLYIRLKEEKKKSQDLSTHLIQLYSESVKQLSDRLIELREIACSAYLNDGNVVDKISQLKERQQCAQVQVLKDSLCSQKAVDFLMRGQSAGMNIEELSKLMQKYDVREPKDLLCDGRNPIARLCVNPDCDKPALICNQIDCSSCGGESHLQCSHRRLDGMTDILRKKAKARKDFILSIGQIENKFISELQDSKKELTQKYNLGTLQQKYVGIIEQIYQKGNSKCLSGQEAKDLLDQLEDSDTMVDFDAESLIKQYMNQIHDMADRIPFLKQILLSSQNQYPVEKKQGEETVKRNKIKRIGRVRTEIDQQSLLQKLPQEQKLFVCDSLNNPLKIKLIFKASQHNFSASKFHQMCDNTKNTLVIARTQFGKTIAGYTYYKWNQSSGYVQDEGRKTFLMQVDLRQKMVPVSDSCLIYCNIAYGPTFGGGNDLYISDICQACPSSYAMFPHTYNRQDGEKYVPGQESNKMFSGATKNKYFKVQQYEVYEVIWQ